MRKVSILNTSRPLNEALIVGYYDTFLLLFKGLMMRKSLNNNEGVLLVESQESRMNASIHMLFMRFDIAAVWIDSSLQVVDVQLARKWNLMYIPKAPARYILEIHSDRYSDFHIGDRLVFEQI